jgi:hypothetical protein
MSQVAATTTLTSTLQQAHWAKLLELEYPLEQEVVQPISSETSLVEDLLMMQDRLRMETPLIQQEIQELEEGEIPQTLEEGEILLTANSPTNY